MLSFLLTGAFIFILFLLQTAVFPLILPVRVFPNLLIILTASKGFMKGENAGMAVGFFCGLIYDIFFGGVIGFYALLYTYVGFINGKFSRVFYPEDIKLPLALIMVSDLTYDLLVYLFLFLIWGKFDIQYYFLHVILPELVVTLVATLALYPIILKMNEGIRKSRRKREY